MAINETEQLSSSLLGSGGVRAPLEEQPGETQVAMSRISGRLSRPISERLDELLPHGPELMPGSSEDVLRAARQKIKQRQQDIDEEAEVASPSSAEPADAPDVTPVVEEAPPATPSEAERLQSEQERLRDQPWLDPIDQLDPDAPAPFIEKDPYDNYIKVDDSDVDAVMNAPANRDELLAGGLSDFNSGRLPDEAGIQERMQAISGRYAGQITDAKRDEITHEATRQMADLLGANPDKLAQAILNRRTGETIQVEGQGLAETMLAARDLLVSEMRKLDGLAERAAVGGEEDLLAFRYQMELVANLQQNIKGSQTEIARALGQFNIPAKTFEGIDDPLMAQRLGEEARTRDFTALLQEWGGPDSIRKIAEVYNKRAAPHKKAAFIRGSLHKKVFNAVYEVWQHALLTNPITQTKNIIGGVIGTFIMPNIEGLAAVGVGKIRRLAGSTDEVFTGGDLQARLFGQMMALREAFIGSVDAFANMGSNELPGFKIDRAREGRHPAFSGAAFGQTGAIGTTIDWFGNLLTAGRVSFRTLEAGDVFFKVVAHRSTMYEEAFRLGRAQGLDGDDLSSFIAEAVVNPPPKMMEKAEAAAKYQTLQTDMDSTGRALQTLQRIPMLRYGVPFLKTPYNAAKYSFLDRTPLGLAWGETNNMLKAGGAQRDEAIARMAIGTSIGATMFGLAATGDITGGGPTDPNMRRILRESGWQPYSIKVGGEYLSYAGMEPLSSIIGAWADASEISMNSDLFDEDSEFDFDDVMGAALGATLYNVSNKTFMEGFSNLVALKQDPRRYGGKFFTALGTSIVPRAVSYVERLNDPVIRDAKNFIEKIKAQIPGMSKDLKPLVGLRGQDVHAGNWNPETKSYDLAWGPDIISPAYRSKYRDDPVVNAAKTLGTISLQPAPSALSDAKLDDPIGLTDDERYWYQKRAHSLGWEMLTAYVENPQVKELLKRAESSKTLKETLQTKLRTIWLKAREQAEKELKVHPKHGRSIQKHISALLDAQTKTLEDELKDLQP